MVSVKLSLEDLDFDLDDAVEEVVAPSTSLTASDLDALYADDDASDLEDLTDFDDALGSTEVFEDDSADIDTDFDDPRLQDLLDLEEASLEDSDPLEAVVEPTPVASEPVSVAPLESVAAPVAEVVEPTPVVVAAEPVLEVVAPVAPATVVEPSLEEIVSPLEESPFEEAVLDDITEVVNTEAEEAPVLAEPEEVNPTNPTSVLPQVAEEQILVALAQQSTEAFKNVESIEVDLNAGLSVTKPSTYADPTEETLKEQAAAFYNLATSLEAQIKPMHQEAVADFNRELDAISDLIQNFKATGVAPAYYLFDLIADRREQVQHKEAKVAELEALLKTIASVPQITLAPVAHYKPTSDFFKVKVGEEGHTYPAGTSIPHTGVTPTQVKQTQDALVTEEGHHKRKRTSAASPDTPVDFTVGNIIKAKHVGSTGRTRLLKITSVTEEGEVWGVYRSQGESWEAEPVLVDKSTARAIEA